MLLLFAVKEPALMVTVLAVMALKRDLLPVFEKVMLLKISPTDLKILCPEVPVKKTVFVPGVNKPVLFAQLPVKVILLLFAIKVAVLIVKVLQLIALNNVLIPVFENVISLNV